MGKPGRPATGQKPVQAFRPPERLWKEFEARFKAAGLTKTDALIEAVEDWNRKQDRKAAAAQRKADQPRDDPHS